MYLLSTMEEINKLRRAINPTAQIMDYLYSRPPAEGSMAEFFMESEDIELAMEDDAMPYFDEIEDDIINMRRDINGFKLHISPPRYLDKPNPGDCPVNFKGWTFEVKNQPVDLGEHVEWDDI